MSENLYIKEKEQMEKSAEAHKKMVWTSIKFTFVAFAALLLVFLVTVVISLILGGNIKDTEPPTFAGPPNNTVIGYVGETPVYKTWVKVIDEEDENAKIVKVDNSAVDINQEGTYKVVYYAEDASGNRSHYVLTYIVKGNEFSREQLMELIAEEAEANNITSDMTKTEKVRAIYKYVQSKVKWDNDSDLGESNIPNIDRKNWQNDWIEEAVLTLDSRVGDCYSYYSLSKAFFEYFGISNEGIQRSDELSNMDGTHFWSVVEVEEGWYYYDGTRLAGKFDDGTNNACLITQEKLDSYRTSDGDDDFYAMRTKISKVSKTALKD